MDRGEHAAGVLRLDKTATATGQRTLTATGKDGTQKTSERTFATKYGAPLLITAEPAAAGLAVLARRLKSGTLVATGKDGSRIRRRRRLRRDHTEEGA